jgi:EAL domain-containing protein (putative c-di-GMP-specific phosphodiesterase class I)/PAS domain-containing protein
VQLLFVGVRPDDADPVLDAMRQAGVVSRPVYVDTDTGLEPALRQSKDFDVILVSMRSENVNYSRAMAFLAEELPQAPIVAWSSEVQSDWLAEAYASGAWSFALASYPAQASQVIRQVWSFRQERDQLSQAKRSAEEVQHRESTLLATARDPVAYVHEGMHIRANQAYLDFFGIGNADDIEGLPLLDLIAPEKAPEAKAMLKSASRGDEVPEALFDMQTIDGEARQARISMTPSMYEGEHCLQVALRPAQESLPIAPSVEVFGYNELVNDLGERQMNPEEARKTVMMLASVADQQAFDGIGLANAVLFMRSLAERFVEQCDKPIKVFDVDGRTLGALISNVAPDEARNWLAHFRESVALHPIETGDRSLRPLVAMGGVMLGPDWKDIQQDPFLRAEDLWRHARISRELEWFDPAARDREEDRRRQELADFVKKSITGGGMFISYRPILPLAGEGIEIFEVFIRLRGPDGGVMRPESFLPLAESQGLGAQIDDVTVGLATLALFDARRQGRDPRIVLSIGLSSLQDDKFAYRLVGALDEKQIPRDRIIIQVPEDIARANQGAVERLTNQHKELGFELLISRFMGEPESISLVKAIGPRWVKFDESWTRDLPRNDKRQAAFKETVATLNGRGIFSIADFIRDSATMTVLFSAQVSYAAGDFLGGESQTMSAIEQ